MNKLNWIITLPALLFLLLLWKPALAQYVNVQIDIRAEVDAEVRQPLDFGTMVSNSGIYRIEPGHPDMGVFAVRVIQAQSMLFNLELPEYLVHSQPESEARIPISLEAAYTNFGEDDFSRAVPMRIPYEEVVMFLPDDPSHEWATAFIYLYGEIDIGDIPEGNYHGKIILNIEYE
jgi:hypothetical protein